ncbi:MAG: hypothetical protein ACYC2H_10220 [Thermoplasmatota archaeon]
MPEASPAGTTAAAWGGRASSGGRGSLDLHSGGADRVHASGLLQSVQWRCTPRAVRTSSTRLYPHMGHVGMATRS